MEEKKGGGGVRGRTGALLPELKSQRDSSDLTDSLGDPITIGITFRRGRSESENSVEALFIKWCILKVPKQRQINSRISLLRGVTAIRCLIVIEMGASKQIQNSIRVKIL